MIVVLYLLAALCLVIGFYCLWAQVAHVPTFSNSRVIASLNKGTNKKVKSLESILLMFANKLSDIVVMDDYKRRRLKEELEGANISMTPEAYVAYAWLCAVLVAALAIPFIFIFPYICPVFIAFAVIIYFKKRKSADSIISEKREAVEKELLRFVSTIGQELKRTNDLIGILESYATTAMPFFKRELEILTVDMRTGNPRVALQRFEAKLNSSKINQVVKGFHIVLEGNDSQSYWENLSDSLIDQERQRLKKIAIKRPAKVRKYSAIILILIIATYLIIMGMDIMSSIDKVF